MPEDPGAEGIDEDIASLLDEQKAYYRARAGEYESLQPTTLASVDELRTGSAASDEEVRQFRAERDEVIAAFDELDLGSDVLELAGGTGIWTRRIAERAGVAKVTVVDASIEMVTQNLANLGTLGEKVRYNVADIFTWQPDRPYSAVVFCYWISHVPGSHLEAFFEQVAGSLAPGGTLFFVDDKELSVQRESLPVQSESATASGTSGPDQVPSDAAVLRQTIAGRTFRIVKAYRPPEVLAHRFAAAGLDVEVSETPSLFQYGSGRKRVVVRP